MEIIVIQAKLNYKLVASVQGRGQYTQHMRRVGQNREFAPYMTVWLVISLQKIPYIFPRDWEVYLTIWLSIEGWAN
jgi:hypothetical protein